MKGLNIEANDFEFGSDYEMRVFKCGRLAVCYERRAMCEHSDNEMKN